MHQYIVEKKKNRLYELMKYFSIEKKNRPSSKKMTSRDPNKIFKVNKTHIVNVEIHISI